MGTDNYFTEQNMGDEEALRERCKTLPTRATQDHSKPKRRSSHASIRTLQGCESMENAPVTRRNPRFPLIDLQIGSDRRNSRRSSFSITTPCTPGIAPIFPIMKYESVWGPSLILKLSELIVAGLCATLYSSAVPYSFKNCIITNEESISYYISTAIFPYIVFCTFIIISGINFLGYILGQPMPAVLDRAFGLLAVAMFITSSGVTLHRWLHLTYSQQDRFTADCSGTSNGLLMASAISALIEAILYSIDIIVTLSYTIKQINAIAPTSQREIATSAARKAEAMRLKRNSKNYCSSVV